MSVFYITLYCLLCAVIVSIFDCVDFCALPLMVCVLICCLKCELYYVGKLIFNETRGWEGGGGKQEHALCRKRFLLQQSLSYDTQLLWR